ncbi:hypothetical protein P378_05060 [Desulforamulus profundi]|uniref:Uncharacterized protein n=1 Tax=Desulforamulus profundi TaxID=1383067 RepID=A0A2C6MHF5_9FIRM|nr:hypothetical protein [Desulforamulus profundi]PHJ39174.1 hypothetical protein P378_05060 [Desulforamulus profundi]
MPMMYGYGMGWFGGILMMLIPLALLGLVVYWAVNSGVKNALRNTAEFTPQILKSKNSNDLANSDDKKD